MTKITALTGLVFLASSSVFAGTLPKCGENDPGDWQGLNGVVCVLMFGSITTTALPIEAIATTGSGSTSDTQNREEYVGIVREDAAAFVGDNGQTPANAMLAEVMTQVRAKIPGANQMNDLELAKLVEVDFN